MDAVLRSLAVYVFIFVVFRLAGKRTFAELTPFDFILLLIVAESTQQALLGDDFSLTNAFIIIITLVSFDIGLSLLKRQFPKLDMLLEGLPVVVMENGALLQPQARKSRVDEEDVLTQARVQHGLERLEQIKFAVLERNGGISVIPHEGEAP